MIKRTIRAVAKIERATQNFFFAKMLYGTTNLDYVETIYEVEDSRLIDTIIELSNKAIATYPVRKIGNSIIIYDPNKKEWHDCSKSICKIHNKIIVGTKPDNNFEEINYLIKIISCTIEENNMGEFWVQYGNKLMSKEEFYEFQKKL